MFDKLKNFFKKIFLKQKLLEENKISNEKIVKNENEKNDFKKQYSKDYEIYDIQKKYEKGEISEDDLTISQIKKLINLYKEQINN